MVDYFIYENHFDESLINSSSCCIFSPLCRFCEHSRIKCYVEEQVFLGWCNFYLKLVGEEIETVTQLWDWTLLLALLDGLNLETQVQCDKETIAGFRHYYWDIVQEYLVKEKVVKSVSLNDKAVLVRKKFTHWIVEIIWCLIFRHHFNLTTVKMSRRPFVDYHKASTGLLKWMRNKLPSSCKINDILLDLSDGVVLCQLVNAIAPCSIDCLYAGVNACAEDVVCYAMQAAKDVLGIPPLVMPEEIVDCNADEKSLITYLALFRSADRMLSRGIRPISPRMSPRGGNNFINNGLVGLNKHGYFTKTQLRKSQAKQSIAYGFGIRCGEVGKPTEFVVHLNGKSTSELCVSIKCFPDSDHAELGYLKAEPKIKPVGESSYVISYTPIRSGDYEISVLCGRTHIYNSPFKVNIKDPAASFRCVNEPDSLLSIEPINHLSSSDYMIFHEESPDTSPYTSEKCFKNSPGELALEKNKYVNNNSIQLSLDDLDCTSNDSVFLDRPEASPKQKERCTGILNADSSLGSSVSSSLQEILSCTAVGKGLSSGEVGVMSYFEVHTSGKSNGPLNVLITCPAMSIPTPHVNTRVEGGQLIHDVMYLPTEPGTYEIELKWGNKLIHGSPYRAVVIETHSTPTTHSHPGFADVFRDVSRRERTAVVFYSATSSDRNHKQRWQYLESILRGSIEQLHVDSIAADIALSGEQRAKLFSITQTRSTPFVFVHKKFLGTYNTVVALHRNQQLKGRLHEIFDDAMFDYRISDFIDMHIIHDIKLTLKELENPPSEFAAQPTNSTEPLFGVK
eukprot:gene17545-19295_t